MNASNNSKSVKSATRGFTGLEALEGRQLMSATGWTVPTAPAAVGAHLSARVIRLREEAARAAKAAKIAKAAKAAAAAASAVAAASAAAAAAATPSQALGVNQVPDNNGIDLLIQGSTGNDEITVSEVGNTFTIRNGTWSTTVTGAFNEISVYSNGGNDSIALNPNVTVNADLHGGAGNDTLISGSGNDSIYGGSLTNVITAGKGTDTIVTIGSNADTITGGAGFDSFWMDNSTTEKITNVTAAETKAGAVHKVGSFLSVQTATGKVAVSKTIANKSGVVTTLPEPTTTESDITYKSFASQPLFSSAGPTADDINQGYVGDCYFLSTLASVAKTDANLIKQSVVSLGDGTFAVQFNQNGTDVFVRVDANLPTWSWGQLAYANEGAGGSIWTAVMEKAFTCYRDSSTNTVASYNNIEAGWMDEVYSDLGCTASDIWSAKNGAQLLSVLGIALAQGKSATFAVNTAPANSGLVSQHAYTVISVQNDAKGNPISITLRNPWGVSASGSGSPYITVSATVAYQAFWAAMTAAV